MSRHLRLSASLAALLIAPAGVASSQPLSHRTGAHRPAHVASHGGERRGPVPQNPRYGYSENPYDPAYRGPGWQVFALQHRQEQRAGLLHEVAPDAKISASGIVVGGD